MEDRSSKERDERRRACRCHRCERRKSARRERPRETRSDRCGKSSDGTGARVAILEADLVALPLPAWLPRDAAERGYALVQTRGNGDCLFESVSVALSTAMRGRPYTPTHLRKAVARTVTDASDRRASAALSAWRSMLEGAVRSSDDHDDGEMLRQVAHAYPLLFDADPPGPRTRKEVSRLMLDPAVYWGDQYAVEVLERCLDVRIVVLVPSAWEQGTREPSCEGACVRAMPSCWFDAGGARRRWHLLLVLEGMHYSPLVEAKRPHDDLTAREALRMYKTSFEPSELPRWARDNKG